MSPAALMVKLEPSVLLFAPVNCPVRIPPLAMKMSPAKEDRSNDPLGKIPRSFGVMRIFPPAKMPPEEEIATPPPFRIVKLPTGATSSPTDPPKRIPPPDPASSTRFCPPDARIPWLKDMLLPVLLRPAPVKISTSLANETFVPMVTAPPSVRIFPAKVVVPVPMETRTPPVPRAVPLPMSAPKRTFPTLVSIAKEPAPSTVERNCTPLPSALKLKEPPRIT